MGDFFFDFQKFSHFYPPSFSNRYPPSHGAKRDLVITWLENATTDNNNQLKGKFRLKRHLSPMVKTTEEGIRIF